ncbi:hypothetical protein K378_04036 [Streptomyces sp. Amel2xB2]|uniref:hypothetical protein n=1 Tax=Streptomyces sp. Amel2xB2 TaxID=1305829 RepID=UPI000DB92CF1|nr:hypothetical protein [Streptomyces sp. Amel2xB2]RAJ61676.1 hypothetical protein K378_04036 [Streptomyces sp. Amel2xB2]
MTFLDELTEATRPNHDVDLVPTLLLQSPTSQAPLRGRVSLGTPVVRPLTAAQAAEGDGDWLDFLESQAGEYDYLFLSVVCSFRPSPDGTPFADAGIGIRLEAPGEPAARQPIARSISPKKRALPATPSATQLTLTAKLLLVEAGVEYAPEQGGREELFVVGMGERDSDPEWRFSATASTPLVGDESLALIVRVPAGVAAHAHITVAATVKQRRLGLIPYRAELPHALRTIDFR